VRNRWFAMPAFIALLPIPLTTVIALLAARVMLGTSRVLGTLCWMPFVLVVLVFLLGALGLAYSLYPYVVMDRLTVWQAASSTEALEVILAGTAVAVPAIAGYTVFAYRVFRGKASALSYG
jgi:cytochrome d ubiquinol oxidase subunit II